MPPQEEPVLVPTMTPEERDDKRKELAQTLAYMFYRIKQEKGINWRPDGKDSVFDTTKRYWQERIPIASGTSELVAAFGGGKDHAVARRLAEGRVNVDDLDYFASMMIEQERLADRGIVQGAFDIATYMPAFISEFALGGLAAKGTKAGAKKLAPKILARAGAKKAATEAVEAAGEKLTMQALGKDAASTLAKEPLESLLQTAFMPGQIARSLNEMTMPEIEVVQDPGGIPRFAVTENTTSMGELPKAFVDAWIEVFSERIGGPLSRTAAVNHLKSFMASKAASMFKIPFKDARRWLAGKLAKVGWHGILSEMLEERVGENLRAVVGLGEGGATGAVLRGDYGAAMKQLMTEALGFGMVGGAIGTADTARDLYLREQARRGGQADMARYLIKRRVEQLASMPEKQRKAELEKHKLLPGQLASAWARVYPEEAAAVAELEGNEPSRTAFAKAAPSVSLLPYSDEQRNEFQRLVRQRLQEGVETQSPEEQQLDEQTEQRREEAGLEPQRQTAEALGRMKEHYGVELFEASAPATAEAEDVEEFARAQGLNMLWVDSESDTGVGGFYDPETGVMAIHVKSGSFWRTVGHEALHALELDGLDSLFPKELVQAKQLEILEKHADGPYKDKLKSSPELLAREAKAYLTGQAFLDKEVQDQLRPIPTLWQAIKRFLNRVLGNTNLSPPNQAVVNAFLRAREQTPIVQPSKTITMRYGGKSHKWTVQLREDGWYRKNSDGTFHFLGRTGSPIANTIEKVIAAREAKKTTPPKTEPQSQPQEQKEPPAPEPAPEQAERPEFNFDFNNKTFNLNAAKGEKGYVSADKAGEIIAHIGQHVDALMTNISKAKDADSKAAWESALEALKLSRLYKAAQYLKAQPIAEQAPETAEATYDPAKVTETEQVKNKHYMVSYDGIAVGDVWKVDRIGKKGDKRSLPPGWRHSEMQEGRRYDTKQEAIHDLVSRKAPRVAPKPAPAKQGTPQLFEPKVYELENGKWAYSLHPKHQSREYAKKATAKAQMTKHVNRGGLSKKWFESKGLDPPLAEGGTADPGPADFLDGPFLSTDFGGRDPFERPPDVDKYNPPVEQGTPGEFDPVSRRFIGGVPTKYVGKNLPADIMRIISMFDGVVKAIGSYPAKGEYFPRHEPNPFLIILRRQLTKKSDVATSSVEQVPADQDPSIARTFSEALHTTSAHEFGHLIDALARVREFANDKSVPQSIRTKIINSMFTDNMVQKIMRIYDSTRELFLLPAEGQTELSEAEVNEFLGLFAAEGQALIEAEAAQTIRLAQQNVDSTVVADAFNKLLTGHAAFANVLRGADKVALMEMAAQRAGISMAEAIADNSPVKDVLPSLVGAFHAQYNEQVHEQLRNLSYAFRHMHQITAAKKEHRRYRNLTAEIYADFIAALLTDPGLVDKHAPRAAEAFKTYFSLNKPEEGKAWFALTKLMAGDAKSFELAEHDAEQIEAMFGEGYDKRLTHMREIDRRRSSVADRIFGLFLDRTFAAKKRSNAIGAVILDELFHLNNPVTVFLADLEREVFAPLKDAGIAQSRLSLHLFWTRVKEGRTRTRESTETENELLKELGRIPDDWDVEESVKLSDGTLVNPKMATYESAERGLEHLRQVMSQQTVDVGGTMTSAWDVLDGAAKRFHDIVFDVVKNATDEGLFSKELFENVIVPNKDNYAAFSVIRYYNGKTKWQVKEMVGTISDVEDPAISTMAKMIAMLRATQINRATRHLVGHMEKSFPKEIKKIRSFATGAVPKAETDTTMPIHLWVDGKVQWYVVPREVGMSVRFSRDLGMLNQLGELLSSAVYTILHPLYVTWSVSFAVANPIRDMRRTWKNMGSRHDISFWTIFKETLLNAENWKTNWRRSAGVFDEEYLDMLRAKAVGIPYVRMDAHAEGLGKWRETWRKIKAGTAAPWEAVHETIEDRGRRETERLMRQHHIDPTKAEFFTKKQNLTWWQWAMNVPQRLSFTTEMMSKTAGWRILGREHIHDRPEQTMERAFIVRKLVGTPDVGQRGHLTGSTNAIFMYSKVRWNAAAAEAAMIFGDDAPAEKPGEPPASRRFAWAPRSLTASKKARSVWWMRSLYGTLLPAWLTKLAMTHPDSPFKEMFSRLPSYFVDNYDTLPLFTVGDDDDPDKAQTVAMTLPMHDVDRVLRSVTMNMIDLVMEATGDPNLETPKQGIRQPSARIWSMAKDLFVPSFNPYIEGMQVLNDYMSNVNPVDNFRNRNVIPQRNWDAGGWQSHKKLLAYFLDQTGVAGDVLGLPLKMMTGESYDPNEQERKILFFNNLPGPSRLLKITNQGTYEAGATAAMEQRAENARFNASLPAVATRMASSHNFYARRREAQAKNPARWAKLRGFNRHYLKLRTAIKAADDRGDDEGGRILREQLGEIARVFNRA